MFPNYKTPRPVGNHPGAMPWDESCDKDHDDALFRHVFATAFLEKGDPRKFLLSSPKEVISSYQCIYNNPPVFPDGKQLAPIEEGLHPAYSL